MGSDDNGKMGPEVDSRLDDFFGDEKEDSGSEDIDYEGSGQNIDDFYSDDDEGGPVLKEDSEMNVDDSGVDIQQGPISPPAAAGGKKNKGKPPQKPAKKDTLDVDNSDLKELKSVILSLEWEITDQLMYRLNDEVTKLEKSHKNDKILVAFLQLMGSLGKYVQKKKAGAHPDSIALLNSVYENLEQVILSSDMSDGAKKKILVSEVNKYKKLKEQIKDFGKGKKAKAEPEPAPAEPSPEPEYREEMEAASGAEGGNAGDVVHTLNKIGNNLLQELQAIREELRLLRENR